MTAKVIALPTANTPVKSCSQCRHNHPDISSFGYKRRTLMEWLKGKKREPDSQAMRFAVCSAFGGNYASIEFERRCDGKYWEPKE